MELAVPVRWAMSGVFATLVAASATTATLGRLRPAMDLGEVRLRVRSWWVMAAAFVAALAVHRGITVVFLAAVGVAAVVELSRFSAMVLPTALIATVAGYGLAARGQAPMLGWAVVAGPVGAALFVVGRGALGLVLDRNVRGCVDSVTAVRSRRVEWSQQRG